MAPRTLKADLVLFGLTAWWGFTFVIVKDALSQADAFTFLTLRFLVGGLCASAIAGRSLLDRRAWKPALVLSSFLFAGYAFQTVGLEHTTPARSAFITGLAVVLVPGVSMVVFKRVPRAPSWVGVLFAVCGLWLLTGLSSGELSQATVGDLLTLGCSAAFAFHIVLTGKYAREVPTRPLVAIQLWVVAVGSAVLVPFGAVKLDWTWAFVGAVLLTGTLGSAVAINLQNWAQAKTSAVRAALLYSLEPVFAAAYSSALGREQLGRREYAGGAMLLLAVLVSELGQAWLDRRTRRALLRPQ